MDLLPLGGYVSSFFRLLFRMQADLFVSDIDEHDHLAASQPVVENKRIL